MSVKQAKSVDDAAQGMSRIHDVAKNNSNISFIAKETANRLDEDAEKLIKLAS